MYITLERFASGGAWAELRVEEGHTVIRTDVWREQYESTAERFMDMAYDLLRAAGRDDICPQLLTLLEAAGKPKQEIENG